MIKYLTEVFEATNLLLVNKGGYCCQYKKKAKTGRKGSTK